MKRFLFFFLLFVSCSGYSQSRMLSPADMQRDLAILYAAWTTLHPGIYRYNTPEGLEARFNAVRARTAQPLDEKKFYLLLSQLAETVHCGHTYLNPLNLPKAAQARLLPDRVIPLFFVLDQKRHLVITHSVDTARLRAGDRIMAINGVPCGRIIDSLLTVSRSDGRNAIGKKLNNCNETPDEANGYSLFDIYFPLFFPHTDTVLTIMILPFSQRVPRRVAVTTLSLAARMERYEQRYGPVPTGEKTFVYRMVCPSVAYMKFGTFAFWNSTFDPAAYVDSVFADLLGRGGVRDLIIDIRGNEGGDNTGNRILSYIVKSKTGCVDPDRPCYRYLAIDSSLLPFLSTWDPSFKKPKDPSLFFRNEIGLYEHRKADPCDFIVPRPRTFRGRVWLLTDARNSSAGFEMARNFRAAGRGRIVGEETGGSQQGINGGEFFFLTLPHSQMEIDLPLIFNDHPGKPDRGIAPDVRASVTQQSIARGRDRQLDVVMEEIGRAR
ncbi:MAG: hypothetical protein JWP27_533 [Flaviaesturariibacter sp.]|nr:hypothetical protein [Flaviaesturariibacter sp.]